MLNKEPPMTDTATDVAQFSQATALDYIDEHLDADRKIMQALNTVKGARKDLKDLRERIKGDGINLPAFDKMLGDAKISGEERETRDRHYRRLMFFIGKPVGTQGMFEFGVQTETDKAQVNVSRLKEVDNEGYQAGLRGDRADSNSWTPGTEEHQRFSVAWLRGQEEKVTKEIMPTTGKRGPGRPRKAANGATPSPANGSPVEPSAEAHDAGIIDAAAGTRANADRWPPGAPGHADYELARAGAPA